MLGDPVDVEIEKVDALRHQIDLAVLLPAGSESFEEDDPTADSPGNADAAAAPVDASDFMPVAVLSES
jgi:ribonuclease R